MLHIILYAIVPIFVIMALGYYSGKSGAFSGNEARVFNKLVLNYALPAALFVSIIKANRAMLAVDIKLTIVSFVVLMACFFLVYFVFKYLYKDTTSEAAISALISGSPTIGFLGFAVLQPIFGTSAAVGLVIAIVAIEVNALGIPIGLSLLNAGDAAKAAAENGGKKPSAWKPVLQALEQPVAWAPILAVILVLCGLKWPTWLLHPHCRSKRLCRRVRSRYHALLSQNHVQQPGFHGFVPETRHYATGHTRRRPDGAYGSSQPKDARCLRRPASGIFRHYHSEPLQLLCGNRHIVARAQHTALYGRMPPVDMAYRRGSENVRIKSHIIFPKAFGTVRTLFLLSFCILHQFVLFLQQRGAKPLRYIILTPFN